MIINQTNMLTDIKYKMKLLLVGIICAIATIVSCKKPTGLAEDPYAGGKKPLDITFISKTTDPEVVKAGDVLSLKVKGLQKYINDFKVYVNEVEADVIKESTNDSTLTFKIPLEASTGSMWITSQSQTFFGPIVKIGGKLEIDGSWKIINGANGPVYDIEALPSGRYWAVGLFNSFELKGTEALPNGGIAQILADGTYATTDINFGKGARGVITSIARISTGDQTGKFIISGSFSAYNSTRPNRQTLNSIARLNANGTLDSVVVSDIVNPKPQETYKNADTLSAFNAGVDGQVIKSFIFNDKIYFVGYFNNFKRMFLRNSTYDDKAYDLTRMRQMVRVDMSGAMDSTFYYNQTTRQSEAGPNGTIRDAMMQSNGQLILVGNFTTFNGKPANRIVRLNLDGSVDNSFGAGSGANDDINSIRFNEKTQQIVISGSFNTFNGKTAPGINLLDKNGANISTFTPQVISGGIATFAGQLDNGKIIVTGSFLKYGTYLRQGFMVLDPTGQLSIGYNNTGGFQGRVYDMIETATATGSKVILVGNILRFNSALPHNLLRLNFNN